MKEDMKKVDVETKNETDGRAFGRLDRNRPFGEISGEMEDFPTARYAQDGNLYDSKDNKLNNG